MGWGTKGTSGEQDVGPWWPLLGGLGLLPPVLLFVSGTSVIEPSTEGHKRRGKQKQERGARMFWAARPHTRQGARGASVFPLQHWACRAAPGHPSHPRFPSCIPVLGGKGEQQEQGWPCVPGVSPWRWRAAPPQRGCLYLSLPPAGRNKGLFVLWRVWSLWEEW